ncbi:unnamed protein product [Gongylonema pulchrum]|uniref:Uncharacterized protein n=1 Tax=Gongylonema pulchrum TaxID=637853 RepID=A0A183E9P2_9BILA|nr:unnamed protein product [Gongylonema pulchrum]
MVSRIQKSRDSRRGTSVLIPSVASVLLRLLPSSALLEAFGEQISSCFKPRFMPFNPGDPVTADVRLAELDPEKLWLIRRDASPNGQRDPGKPAQPKLFKKAMLAAMVTRM